MAKGRTVREAWEATLTLCEILTTSKHSITEFAGLGQPVASVNTGDSVRGISQGAITPPGIGTASQPLGLYVYGFSTSNEGSGYPGGMSLPFGH